MRVLFITVLLIYILPAMSQVKQSTISVVEMQKLYDEVKTPHKYGLVVVPSEKKDLIDCPSVYKVGKKWFMTYIIFDGIGYETHLAESNDLLNWKYLGKQLSTSSNDNSWDSKQKAGYNALINTKWGGKYDLKKYKGKYWMSYFGGNTAGYEPEPLSIGVASTTNIPDRAFEWNRYTTPVLSSTDKDIRWWENRHKLFKSYVIEDKKKNTGHQFIMYYNAVGDSLVNNKKTRWYERIGMAVSDDMVTWKRYLNDPVVHHPVGITGDPMIQRINNTWVMFYFGAFWENKTGGFNRFAASKDLINWTDWTGDDLINSTEEYDVKYAHKSFVIKHKGIVYHFYCAVDKDDNRGIAVATSKDIGKSKLKFIKE
ncbi:glycoside hydrolase family 130 protein [Sphingobacterium bovistauri]|uniref:Glycosylase n=1 Tax=Sphingobacterium bovistauri TaxID=2781959 RepID=A0ABS7Z778_9SPHI|nr:glycosylase [Sphingobacterium bovistauri]MCA5004720.1 glycosylase [Sphingobacterium bovistauri]